MISIPPPQQSQHVTNMQNLFSVEEKDISLVTAVPQPDTKPERHLASNDISDPVIGQYHVSIVKQHVADNSNIKSIEERETDAFLDSSSITKNKKSQSHKKREAENIVQDVFDFTAISAPEKNHITEISMTA
ncbi:unnamed protein product [Rhizophagus irregularis]|nr:unnamed protein product [Rhizophagus irregularis]